MGSPIEIALRKALLDECPTLIDQTALSGVVFEQNILLALQPADAIVRTLRESNKLGDVNDVHLFAQARCAGYRVDLLLWSGAFGTLAIECDGFDFHDRTPQQASYDRARDRELVRFGAIVIRFTGSEIYRDVEQCAKDVNATWSAIQERRGAEHNHWYYLGADDAHQAHARGTDGRSHSIHQA